MANPASVGGSHRREYRIKNTRYETDPPRVVDVAASEAEIAFLQTEGYLIRERVLSDSLLAELRQAADEIAAEQGNGGKGGVGGFGGLFVRNLMDRHPAFLKMLKFAPTLSVARAVLGPQVQIHAMVLRVSYPEMAEQQVEWHFHQRVIPEPLPAFFCRPAVLDNLIYLDDLKADWESDGLRLAFTLPSGCYATVLLREVMKADGEDEPQEE